MDPCAGSNRRGREYSLYLMEVKYTPCKLFDYRLVKKIKNKFALLSYL
jgi:hypothetical protein